MSSSLIPVAPSRKPTPWAVPLWLLLAFCLLVWAEVNGHQLLTQSAALIAIVLGCVALPLTEQQIHARGQRIREALRLADIGIRAAALYIYGSEDRATDLVKALQCDRVLDTWKLERLPDEFHRHYALLELRDRGLPEYIRAALKIVPHVAKVGA